MNNALVKMPQGPLVESYVLDNGVGTISNITFDNIFVGGSEITHAVINKTTNPN